MVLSQSWKEYYESTFHFSDVHILNNPVYIPVAPASPASSEPLQLLFLGKICDDKGIFDLSTYSPDTPTDGADASGSRSAAWARTNGSSGKYANPGLAT